MTKKRPQINWTVVEASMRRSTQGRATERDNEICQEAFWDDRKKYGELNKKIREEEFDAERRKYNW